MMYGAAKPDSGELFVLGLNAHNQLEEIKQRVGILPQDNGLDTDFSLYDNLKIFANYHGLSKGLAQKKIENLIHKFNLDVFRDQLVESLSGGTQRKLALARTLLNDPEILFLDEPSTGLDPQARLYMWELIENLKEQGKTIILSTHYMEEAQRLCDRVVMFDKGHIISTGSPEELVAEKVGAEVAEFKVNQKDKDYYIGKLNSKYDYCVLNYSLRVFLSDDQPREKLLDIIHSHEIHFRKANLDDVFLKVAGYEPGEHHE